MAIYLLALAGTALLVALLAAIAIPGLRAILGAVALERSEFSVAPLRAAPGDPIAAQARVVARGGRMVHVSATLECLLVDHRSRRLYTHTVAMTPAQDGFTAELRLPAAALRTGVIGDELSALFSEDARRLLVFWSVVFEVRAAGGGLLRRRTVALDIPSGRPLGTDPAYMNQLVIDTFTSLKDDLLVNWLVKLAAHDGEIAPSERAFLHEVLAAGGLTDPARADERIAAELGRHLDIDAGLLRRHVPAHARIAFYKMLFAIAWRDGTMDRREHAFLAAKLDDFGLSHNEVKDVEREVLRGMAQHSLA